MKLREHLFWIGCVVGVILLVALAVHEKRKAYQSGYNTALADVAKATKGKQEANEQRADSVVTQEVERIVYRDRYITKIQKEIEYVSRPMAQCPIPDAAVGLWNDATNCLFSSETASCGTDAGMPSATTP